MHSDEELGLAGGEQSGPPVPLQIRCKSVILMGGGNINIKGQARLPWVRKQKGRRRRQMLVVTNKELNGLISGVTDSHQSFRMSQPAPSLSPEGEAKFSPGCNCKAHKLYCETLILVDQGRIFRQWQECLKAKSSKRRKRRQKRFKSQKATFNSCKEMPGETPRSEGMSQSGNSMWQEKGGRELPAATCGGQFSPAHVFVKSCESVTVAAYVNVNIKSKIRKSKTKKKQRS